MPKYQYTEVEMEYVEQNAEEFVIDECIEACRILWSKNIFTFMCSNNEDFGTTWIATYELSKENLEILDSMKHLGVVSKYRGAHKLVIDTEGEVAKNKLIDIASQFVMQDIPYGYQTTEGFLISKGCYEEIPNPEFVYMEQVDFGGDFNKWLEYDKYLSSNQSKEKIKVFSEAKMTKSLDKYLEDDNLYDLYIKNEERIYDSKYYFEKHNDYLNTISPKSI